MNTFDLTIYHFFNNLSGHIPFLDATMAFIAQYALEIYAILFVVAWFAFPKSDKRNRHSLVVAGFAGILALIINVMISHIWYRPRPFVTLPQGSFHQLIPHSADASFPSDHGSGSFAFAAASWGRSTTWVRWTFPTLAILVAISRIYVGVHWPTDIIGSFIVGVISARIVWKLSSKLAPITDFGLRMFGYDKSERLRDVE